MFRPHFFKRAVCLFMLVIILLLNFPITARAEEEGVVTSGTLGNISWMYKDDVQQGYQKALII